MLSWFVSVGSSPALVDPVLERFRESLYSVAETHPDLTTKCTELEERIEQMVQRLDRHSGGSSELKH